MSTVFTHPHKSALRLRNELSKLYFSSIHDGCKLICKNRDKCTSSINMSNTTYLPAQAHFVGKMYGLSIDESPLRIVIVGQEYGHGGESPDGHVTPLERSNTFDSASDYKFEPTNPHMRGSALALRYLIRGDVGEDHEDCITTSDGMKVSIYDCFALINYLMCSATKIGSRRGKSTAEMKRNCSENFKAAIELLKPNVLIMQGRSYYSYVADALDLPKDADDSRIFSFCLPTALEPTHYAVLNHPSARPPYGWSSIKNMYYQKVVQHRLKELRDAALSN